MIYKVASPRVPTGRLWEEETILYNNCDGTEPFCRSKFRHCMSYHSSAEMYSLAHKSIDAKFTHHLLKL